MSPCNMHFPTGKTRPDASLINPVHPRKTRLVLLCVVCYLFNPRPELPCFSTVYLPHGALRLGPDTPRRAQQTPKPAQKGCNSH